jgi:hypothetical protein
MNHSRKSALILLAIFMLVTILVLCGRGHCMTTSKHQDRISVIVEQTNPNSFIAGSVTNVEFAGNPENYGMVVRVQPLKSYILYTEDILLCGNPSDEFAGHRNPMVLVYETQSHHMVEGIGCHELRAVRDVVPETLK